MRTMTSVAGRGLEDTQPLPELLAYLHLLPLGVPDHVLDSGPCNSHFCYELLLL